MSKHRDKDAEMAKAAADTTPEAPAKRPRTLTPIEAKSRSGSGRKNWRIASTPRLRPRWGSRSGAVWPGPPAWCPPPPSPFPRPCPCACSWFLPLRPGPVAQNIYYPPDARSGQNPGSRLVRPGNWDHHDHSGRTARPVRGEPASTTTPIVPHHNGHAEKSRLA